MHLWQSRRDPGPQIPENNLAATSKRTLQPVCASLVGSDVPQMAGNICRVRHADEWGMWNLRAGRQARFRYRGGDGVGAEFTGREAVRASIFGSRDIRRRATLGLSTGWLHPWSVCGHGRGSLQYRRTQGQISGPRAGSKRLEFISVHRPPVLNLWSGFCRAFARSVFSRGLGRKRAAIPVSYRPLGHQEPVLESGEWRSVIWFPFGFNPRDAE